MLTRVTSLAVDGSWLVDLSLGWIGSGGAKWKAGAGAARTPKIGIEDGAEGDCFESRFQRLSIWVRRDPGRCCAWPGLGLSRPIGPGGGQEHGGLVEVRFGLQKRKRRCAPHFITWRKSGGTSHARFRLVLASVGHARGPRGATGPTLICLSKRRSSKRNQNLLSSIPTELGNYFVNFAPLRWARPRVARVSRISCTSSAFARAKFFASVSAVVGAPAVCRAASTACTRAARTRSHHRLAEGRLEADRPFRESVERCRRRCIVSLLAVGTAQISSLQHDHLRDAVYLGNRQRFS